MNTHLIGYGNPKTAGTTIALASVSVRNVPKGAHAFKLFASGRIPALKLSMKGQLYALNVSSGKWKAIGAITGLGSYAATLK
jgi:hypothetical protein